MFNHCDHYHDSPPSTVLCMAISYLKKIAISSSHILTHFYQRSPKRIPVFNPPVGKKDTFFLQNQGSRMTSTSATSYVAAGAFGELRGKVQHPKKWAEQKPSEFRFFPYVQKDPTKNGKNFGKAPPRKHPPRSSWVPISFQVVKVSSFHNSTPRENQVKERTKKTQLDPQLPWESMFPSFLGDISYSPYI